MQAQNAYMSARQGMFSTFAQVIRNEGFFALYKGLLPPLIGSSIFRSIQFGVYNFFYTHFERDFPNSIWMKEIPYTGGLETRVIAGGIIAATCRTFIEAPLELIKVRRQVGQSWDMKSLFNGFSVTWVRTTGLMVTFFIILDTLSRHAAELLSKPVVGPFIKGGVVSTLAWWLIWPFETLKNQVQGNTEGPKTLSKRFVWVVQNHGAKSLFRGIVPGSARSLIANGASMLVFQSCQDARQHWLESHSSSNNNTASKKD